MNLPLYAQTLQRAETPKLVSIILFSRVTSGICVNYKVDKGSYPSSSSSMYATIVLCRYLVRQVWNRGSAMVCPAEEKPMFYCSTPEFCTSPSRCLLPLSFSSYSIHAYHAPPAMVIAIPRAFAPETPKSKITIARRMVRTCLTFAG